MAFWKDFVIDIRLGLETRSTDTIWVHYLAPSAIWICSLWIPSWLWGEAGLSLESWGEWGLNIIWMCSWGWWPSSSKVASVLPGTQRWRFSFAFACGMSYWVVCFTQWWEIDLMLTFPSYCMGKNAKFPLSFEAVYCYPSACFSHAFRTFGAMNLLCSVFGVFLEKSEKLRGKTLLCLSDLALFYYKCGLINFAST